MFNQMIELRKFVENFYKRITDLKRNDEYKKCLNCDCYFGLLYYMNEELQKNQDLINKQKLADILSAFNKRKEIKIYKCLGCDPCPPAEWTAELIRKSQTRQ